MRFRAEDTYPGNVYYTATGVAVEPALDLRALKERGLIRVRKNDDGLVMFYWLDANGMPSTSFIKGKNKIAVTPLPKDYMVDDRIVRAAPRPGKHGPAPRGKQEWRGWVNKRPELCKTLLEKVTAAGGFVVPSFHYFRLGYSPAQGTHQTFAALFRNGMLGFAKVPQELEGYAVERKRGGDIPERGYRDVRIILEAVVILRRQQEFVVGFESAFKKFIAQAAEAVKR